MVFKLDQMPKGVEPIIQIVDNFARNHKLATIIEFRIGQAKLVMSSM